MKLCELFTKGVYYAFILNSIFILLIPVFLPGSPDQWSSLVQRVEECSMVGLAPFVIGLAYFQYGFITNAYLIIFSVFASLFGMLEIMNQCR